MILSFTQRTIQNDTLFQRFKISERDLKYRISSIRAEEVRKTASRLVTHDISCLLLLQQQAHMHARAGARLLSQTD